jgi:preprotein translocase subunit SecG
MVACIFGGFSVGIIGSGLIIGWHNTPQRVTFILSCVVLPAAIVLFIFAWKKENQWWNKTANN